MMDVFRHIGRGELSGFAGGAEGNRQLEQQFFLGGAYTEDDLQAQVDRTRQQGPRGEQAYQDVTAYLDGLNRYIDDAKKGLYFPGEYDLTGNANILTGEGIQPFKSTDLVAIGTVISALFGSGGGNQVVVRPGEAGRRAEVRQEQGRRGLRRVPDAERPGGRPHPPRRPAVRLRREPRAPARRGHARRGLGDAAADRLRPHRLGRATAERPSRQGPGRRQGQRRQVREAAVGDVEGEPQAQPEAREGEGLDVRRRAAGGPLPRQTRHVQRPGGVGEVHGLRAPRRRVRPADRLLRSPAADAGGDPGARASAPAARPSPGSTCTCSSAVARTTPGARRPPGRPSPTPTPCSCATPTAAPPPRTPPPTSSTAPARRWRRSSGTTRGAPPSPTPPRPAPTS